MGRALPFVLVFSAFLFLNAELWQVANDFTPLAFWISVGLLVAVAGAFIALRIPREIAEIARFESWEGGVCGLADRAGSPLTSLDAGAMRGRCDPPLTRTDRLSVGLVGFLAAFSSLQFAVAVVTDGAYREEFFDDVTREVRWALAVRSVYLDRLVESGSAPEPAPPDR